MSTEQALGSTMLWVPILYPKPTAAHTNKSGSGVRTQVLLMTVCTASGLRGRPHRMQSGLSSSILQTQESPLVPPPPTLAQGSALPRAAADKDTSRRKAAASKLAVRVRGRPEKPPRGGRARLPGNARSYLVSLRLALWLQLGLRVRKSFHGPRCRRLRIPLAPCARHASRPSGLAVHFRQRRSRGNLGAGFAGSEDAAGPPHPA